MFNTMQQVATNAGLSNKAATTFGFTFLGLVVVHEQTVQEGMLARGYPLHTAFGKKFFFCFAQRCY